MGQETPPPFPCRGGERSTGLTVLIVCLVSLAVVNLLVGVGAVVYWLTRSAEPTTPFIYAIF